MIKGLQAAGKENILALGYAIAGHVYQSADDQEWLKRRFEMFHSVLEDSWSYREMVEKEHQQGLEQGLKQGLEQGGLKALCPVLITIVEMRFPDLTSLAQQQAERITVPEQLSTIINALLVAQTSEKARQVLTNIEPPSNTHS